MAAALKRNGLKAAMDERWNAMRADIRQSRRSVSGQSSFRFRAAASNDVLAESRR